MGSISVCIVEIFRVLGVLAIDAVYTRDERYVRVGPYSRTDDTDDDAFSILGATLVNGAKGINYGLLALILEGIYSRSPPLEAAGRAVLRRHLLLFAAHSG